MERLHVFVDEYGDSHLDVSKPGVSSTYIVVALCVRDRALKHVMVQAEEIRKTFFQSGEMKSSSIGAKQGRRLHVMRALSKLDVFIIAYCARKTELDSCSGLSFKKSFVKFFASALYERVTRCGDDIHIVHDEHGSEQFQEELKAYLERKYARDLFSSTKFISKKSEENVLIQAADLFAGSLARIYDPIKSVQDNGELRAALGNSVSVTLWPSGKEVTSLPIGEHAREDDEVIRRYCVKRAQSYLEAYGQKDSDRDEMSRVIFLDALLAHHTLGEPGSFLSTRTLKREISSHLGEPVSDHRFRSVIVAKLRDADVIISSCAKGYRIPSSSEDLREFSAFSNSIIPPMVARLARARKGIREATLGRIDILADAELIELQKIADAVVY
ncbi:uncharacterized protein DUF3800 [Luteimonas cucumeris]|uniref:Uncharacterized protein DUF3800 n=1 Tax=Luteimonas cucumeris TaxID=985012 RepID=A0A562L2D8_9GAMM|nr:DUF3800 domain-containing protein [Luteimonas cucumeris]TWI01830.1 uncharacterized protein DUF3800 [Luteimonas cucumeris]